MLEGTVDYQARFIVAYIGQFGKNYDGHVFCCSILCIEMVVGVFLPGTHTVTVENIQVLSLILANAVYPLKMWLITSYTGALIW